MKRGDFMNPLDNYIAESTECDFKSAVETRKPKSWLKSVSAFSNGTGGVLIFGVEDNKTIIGLDDIQKDSEKISELIISRITPHPVFSLNSVRFDKKNIIILNVYPGHDTPYYYKADGVTEAYVRIGNESVPASNHILNRLILNGLNKSFDSLITPFDFNDYSFSKLRERYKSWTKESMSEKFFDSFCLRDNSGKLTNTGALLADDSPVLNSRVFCTRWNGTDKSGGKIDALDSAEFSGSLITLLNESIGFIKRNMRTLWSKTADSRIEMPDYCERSFFEAVVNALIHRDYLILGSEIHIDMFDDRLSIYSPGGMPDGTFIQNRDLNNVPSYRRNPILADVFSKLGYMERQGSGLNKIRNAYENSANFTKGCEPVFYSDSTQFTVILSNLNYKLNKEKVAVDSEKVAVGSEKVAVGSEKVAVGSEKVAVGINNFTPKAKEKMRAAIELLRDKEYFGRSDIAEIFEESNTSAGILLNQMKSAKVVEPVTGHGKGKFRIKS